MKRIISLLMVLVLCFALAACGGKDTDEKDNGNDTKITEAGKKETSEPDETKAPVENGDDSVKLPVTYGVPMQKIFVDVPAYQQINEGFVEVFIIHESKYVAVTAHQTATAENVTDAHALAFDKFKASMKNYEGGVNSLTVEKEEIKTINGIEVYCFEGSINYGENDIHDGYAKGYSYIMDGIPCMIIGSVIDDAQSADLIKEISETVDAMILTARETE